MSRREQPPKMKPIDQGLARRVCVRKRRYETWEEAQDVLQRHSDPLLRTYFCEFCCGFHNGHPRSAKESARS